MHSDCGQSKVLDLSTQIYWWNVQTLVSTGDPDQGHDIEGQDVELVLRGFAFSMVSRLDAHLLPANNPISRLQGLLP